MLEKLTLIIRKMAGQLKNWRPGRLARGALAMTLGMGGRAAVQAIIFVILAHLLGVKAFGGYAATMALAMLSGLFVGVGSSVLMVRETARDVMSFRESQGHAIAVYILSAPIILVTYFLVGWFVLPKLISWVVLVCLGLAEIIFAPLSAFAIQAYQGHERIGRASRLVLAPVLPRFVAVIAIFLLPVRLPHILWLTVWAVLYLVASVVSAIYCFELMRRDLDLTIRFNWHEIGNVLRQGYPFAIIVAAQKINVDIDKVLLALLSTLTITGEYSAAYRIVDMAGVPLISFFSSAVARFFRAGDHGMRSAMWYAFRVLPLPMLYSVAASVALFELAGMLPWLLGAGFTRSVEALRWLAWLPLLTTPRRFMQHAFNASGRQRTILLVVMCGAVVNVGTNLWAIPVWGWQGAAGAVYAAEIAMSGLLITIARINWNK